MKASLGRAWMLGLGLAWLASEARGQCGRVVSLTSTRAFARVPARPCFQMARARTGCYTPDPGPGGPEPPSGPDPPDPVDPPECVPGCFKVPIEIPIRRPECEAGQECPPGGIRVIGSLLGCGDEVLESQEYILSPDLCVEGATQPCEYVTSDECVDFNFVFEECGTIPQKIRVETFHSASAGHGDCELVCSPGPRSRATCRSRS